MKNNNCIFCKIIDKQIPSNIIYEDDYVLAFLDINPYVLGHTLVIPKKHFKDIFEIDELYYEKLMGAVKKIANHFKEDCGFDGVNIMSNNDLSSGQEVFHIHYHILPRVKDDNIKIYNKPSKMDLNFNEITNKLKCH